VIEQPIIAQKQAEYRKQQETQRRQQEEAERQQQVEYRQKLQQYEQELIKTVEAGNSLDSSQVRQRLRQLQRDLRLKDTDIAAIEAKVVASRRPVTPPPSIQQPSPAQHSETTPLRINRKQFLKWAGLGGAGLVTAVVGREFFKGQSSTVEFETVMVDEKGQVVKRDPNKQAKFFKEDLGNNVTLEMVEIPAGSFKMGSPAGEKGRGENEGPQHTVNVPTFFMGRFAVTQEQYQQVMDKNPSRFKGAKRPVESVSWNEAVEFCKKLSQKTGRTYRLPSEAEWEYAARAGTTTPFHFGQTLTTALANYNGEYNYRSEPKGMYRQQTTEVGSFPPNDFGLYDMHGNVWEWCQDTWHNSYKGAPVDGRAWIDNENQSHRLLRGGSWLYTPGSCRSADRYWDFPDLDDHYIGFRVVCGVAAPRTK
jgi:formylglycine-generating enzyme required for sulfatase activity